jgi:hypothetical protein
MMQEKRNLHIQYRRLFLRSAVLLGFSGFEFQAVKTLFQEKKYLFYGSLTGDEGADFSISGQTWQDSEALTQINSEMLEQGQLILAESQLSGKILSFKYLFRSKADFLDWSDRLLTKNIFQPAKIPSNFKYDFHEEEVS